MTTQAGDARGTDRRVGMTPERVADAAMRLSHGTGLNSWTIRDLATELDVAPSVIYHHSGGREALLRGVVERVIAEVTIPDTRLPWQDWFRSFLLGLRPLLKQYPGTARWLLMHGPSFPSIATAFDFGISSLSGAGFTRPAIGYAMLVNTAMLTITMHDDRLETSDDGPRDHAAMRESFATLGTDSPGVNRMLTELLDPLASDPHEAGEAVNADYYALLIDTLIAGLEAQAR